MIISLDNQIIFIDQLSTIIYLNNKIIKVYLQEIKSKIKISTKSNISMEN